MVTDVRFIGTSNRLVSCSKDTFVKVWDLDTQHCIQTLVGHRTEVWAFDVHPTEPLLVTAAADSKLRVWRAVRPGDVAPAPAAESGALSLCLFSFATFCVIAFVGMKNYSLLTRGAISRSECRERRGAAARVGRGRRV